MKTAWAATRTTFIRATILMPRTLSAVTVLIATSMTSHAGRTGQLAWTKIPMIR